jgi:hypothetical protein
LELSHVVARALQPWSQNGAILEIVSQQVISMVSYVMSEGRLFGLTASDWSVLLGSFTLCGLLTLLF